ncbi:hypothetical protein C8N35_11232 [Breoghania corrubedonensis]|uniref:Uncharacterized protein n=1 Tax=Breoghania corrubedonensis TaxID=665038 RepID=A0A2T5UW15_9HYPH|nr:hypothetical protein [Breoghania corrubedonensis]PTW55707.1 hypothetical protein C8N35_11232 [Breoghania corrubedonensis]
MMMTDCEFELLEKISRHELPSGCEFVPMAALKAALPAYDEDSLKSAVEDLCSLQFLEMKDGSIAITDMGVAAVCSM